MQAWTGCDLHKTVQVELVVGTNRENGGGVGMHGWTRSALDLLVKLKRGIAVGCVFVQEVHVSTQFILHEPSAL